MKSRLIIKIDPQIHKELKIVCIENDQTLTDFVVDAIKKYMRLHEGPCRMIKSRIQSDK